MRVLNVSGLLLMKLYGGTGQMKNEGNHKMPGQQQRTPRTEQARLVTSKDGRSAWLSAYCCSRSKTCLRLSLLAMGERGEFAAVSDGKRRLETISYWYLGDNPFRGRPKGEDGSILLC